MQIKKEFLLVIVLLVFMAGCVTKNTVKNTATAPDWFVKRIINNNPSNNNQHLIVGFGEGSNRAEAKQNALKEISEQIKLKVSSNSQSTKTLNTNNNNTDYQSTFDQKLKITSISNLSGAKLLQEKCNPKTCFAAFGFDNRSLKERLKGLNCQLKRKSNSFKSSLPIDKITACLWVLDYRQNNWYLDVANKSFRLKNIDLFNNFFVSKNNNSSLKINIYPKTRLRYGQYYHIKVESKKSAFLSLFLVNQLGQVQTLLPNKKFSGSLVFPDLKKYDGIIANKDIKDKTAVARDMLLAFMCKQEVNDLMGFTPIGVRAISTNSTTFLYGKLLSASKNCQWSSKFIYID